MLARPQSCHDPGSTSNTVEEEKNARRIISQLRGVSHEQNKKLAFDSDNVGVVGCADEPGCHPGSGCGTDCAGKPGPAAGDHPGRFQRDDSLSVHRG